MKIEAKRKLCEKSEKKRKTKWKKRKNEKIYLNFASLCFASKQTLLNRSEAKNLKRKNAKNSEKSEKSEIVKHMWDGSKFALFRL